MSPSRLIVVSLAAAAAFGACAPALTTAPPLAAIAGGDIPPRIEASVLVERAAALHLRRDLAAVRDASSLALRAAAADPESVEAIVLAVRTLVWLADHEDGREARERAATRAVQAAQWCGAGAPTPLPVCQFWIGAALGVQARERPSTGASALPAIEAAFKAAAAADPLLESAGPDHALALLYLRAPGWPAGPGDPDRGLEHARRAMALRPAHPPNMLALAEALAATGDAAEARAWNGKALERARDAAAAGEPDAPEWIREAEVALASADEG